MEAWPGEAMTNFEAEIFIRGISDALPRFDALDAFLKLQSGSGENFSAAIHARVTERPIVQFNNHETITAQNIAGVFKGVELCAFNVNDQRGERTITRIQFGQGARGNAHGQ